MVDKCPVAGFSSPSENLSGAVGVYYLAILCRAREAKIVSFTSVEFEGVKICHAVFFSIHGAYMY